MYARVTISLIQPGRVDQAIGLYRDSVVPAAKQQKGFKGLAVLKPLRRDKRPRARA